MTDLDVVEASLSAATALRVPGATTAVAERRTFIPDAIPYHPEHSRLAGEPDECPVLPEIQPGQVWVVEHAPTDLHLSPLAHRAVSAADVVIYDRALYAIVASNLPPGAYAEPASSPGKPLDMPIDRCLNLARDGWSVVWLVDHQLQRRARAARIGHLVDRLIDGGRPADLPVTVFMNGHGEILAKMEASLDLLGEVNDARTSGDCLTVALGAVGTGAAADLYAISSNGLAG